MKAMFHTQVMGPPIILHELVQKVYPSGGVIARLSLRLAWGREIWWDRKPCQVNEFSLRFGRPCL